MKKIIPILAMLTTVVFAYSQAQNTWVQKSDFGYNAANVITPPTARSGAVSFSIASKGYCGTGYDGSYKKDFWEYDPTANTWTQKADFGGTARSAAVAFSSSSKGYIGTGYDGIYKKDFWEYDPVANIWTQKADFGGTVRSGAVGFNIENKGYIGTGNNNGTLYKDFWEYDPAANTWAQKADFAGTARQSAVGLSIGTKGYLGTGISGFYKSDFWEYDPASNTWTRKADFGGVARSGALGFSIGNKGYLGTGQGDTWPFSYYFNDFWEYNAAVNTWVQKAGFSGTGCYGAVGFSVGSKAYLGTGSSIDGYSNDFAEYDPSDNAWVPKMGFGGTARASAVGFNISSKGYLGTGSSSSGYMKDFWEYDPVANTWMQKADFGGAHRTGAVGFSIGSKGYIGTGYYSSVYSPYEFYLKDFWEYDPAANTWVQKADFGGLGRSGAVGFSIGSKGYIGTGTNSFLQDFWEYDPSVNSWTQKAAFPGPQRSGAVGFGINDKGYLGTGYNLSNYPYLVYLKDFWEYDPTVNSWSQKADFEGISRSFAVGFSIGNKGYLGSGSSGNYPDYIYYKDFWQYDPAINSWAQQADFGGSKRAAAVGFSIGNKGYIGTGVDSFIYSKQDFWEYTLAGCPIPANLRVPKVSDTAALLKWTLPVNPVSGFVIRYRSAGTNFLKRRVKGDHEKIILTGLQPNTTYSWEIRSLCTADTSSWVNGPKFTTTSSTAFSSIAAIDNELKVQDNVSIQIMPNPNKGNFTLQMQLPAKAASTTFSLYNNLGARLWQQDAGILSGSVSRNIALENKLSAGVYVMMIQHGDIRLMQKVFVIK